MAAAPDRVAAATNRTNGAVSDTGDAALINRLQRRLARERAARLEAERIAEAATLISVQDPLTGLATRRLMVQTIERELARAARRGTEVAILFIDLDGFKLVNDNYGHEAGDRTLVAVAEAIRDVIRATDVAGRLGGDEFLVVAPDLDAAAASRLARRIVKAVAGAGGIVGDTSVQASIGITMVDGSSDAESALRQADHAMYAAKAYDGGGWRVFDPELRQLASQQRSVQRELPGAIERGELAVHYQPVVEISAGTIVTLEALVRWPRADGSLSLPDEFLPFALRSGLIDGVGRLVLGTALADLAQLKVECHAAGRPESPQVAVNVSPRQLGHHGFASVVASMLDDAELHGSDLIVEVTEQAILDSTITTERNLRDLQRLGVGLVLDDFGTGHSSLARLRLHDFDELKIDRTFISNLASSEDDRAIVTAIVAMSHALGARVVAEGVETATQLEIVGELGVDRVQGWFFSRAVEIDAIPPLFDQI